MATVTIQGVELESKDIDMYLAFGIAIQRLGQLSEDRRDLEITLHWGRIEIGYVGEEPTHYAGTYSIQPVAENWQKICDFISDFPRKERK